MAASLTQNSFEPGATLVVRASLTEFGIPLAQTGKVHAELRLPDSTQTVIALPEIGPGVFQADVVASLPGVYHFRLMAAGWTHRGEAFTREQLLTGVTMVGGNSPSPTTPPVDPRGDILCCLLNCLLKNESLSRFIAQHNIDPAALLRCVRACCDLKRTPTERELAEREGTALPTPATVGQLSALLARPDFADVLEQLIKQIGQ
jgi:hypothetical protein